MLSPCVQLTVSIWLTSETRGVAGGGSLTAERFMTNRKSICLSPRSKQTIATGLLRQVSVDGTKTYFDTNVSAHHHFYLENNHELVDIPDPHLMLQKMPEIPEGYEIARVDMVVRLRKKR